jgi:hypothetical protein
MQIIAGPELLRGALRVLLVATLGSPFCRCGAKGGVIVPPLHYSNSYARLPSECVWDPGMRIIGKFKPDDLHGGRIN